MYTLIMNTNHKKQKYLKTTPYIMISQIGLVILEGFISPGFQKCQCFYAVLYAIMLLFYNVKVNALLHS